MPTKVTIELDQGGIRQLLCSAPIGSAVRKGAERIVAVAGEGFEVTGVRLLDFGGGRIGYGVRASSDEARLAEARDKVLSRAVSACRS